LEGERVLAGGRVWLPGEGRAGLDGGDGGGAEGHHSAAWHLESGRQAAVLPPWVVAGVLRRGERMMMMMMIIMIMIMIIIMVGTVVVPKVFVCSNSEWVFPYL
jgi:hypothetical protein